MGKVSIVTDLETLLGIIVSCLPMFPPALKILHCVKRKKPVSRTVVSSSVAQLRSFGLRKPKLRNFDDLYPLTDLEGTTTENQITGPGSRPGSLFNERAMMSGASAQPQSKIQVKQDWEVRSDMAVVKS